MTSSGLPRDHSHPSNLQPAPASLGGRRHTGAFPDPPGSGYFQVFSTIATSYTQKNGGYIAHQLAHWHERGFGHWAVVTQNDNQVVGWNGLEYVPELDEVEVAYLLSQRVRGRGYASEAAHAAIDFGFGTCTLSAIIGLVHPQNIPSVHILEKSGLVYSDKLTLWGLDMSRYRITRSDYEQDHKISQP